MLQEVARTKIRERESLRLDNAHLDPNSVISYMGLDKGTTLLNLYVIYTIGILCLPHRTFLNIRAIHADRDENNTEINTQ